MSHREYRVYERKLQPLGQWTLVCRVGVWPGERISLPSSVVRRGYEYRVDVDFPCDAEP